MSSLRIGLDLFSLVPGVGRGGGFHRYAVELVSALARLPDAHHYFLFVNRRNAGLFPSGERFTQVVCRLPPERELWPLRLAWQHLLLPRRVRQWGLDVLHSPFDTAPVRLSCPSVVTVHDLISDVYYPRHFPGTINAFKARYLFTAKRHAARRASAIICPSQATADEVVRHYGVSRACIRVVPHGADHLDPTGRPLNHAHTVPCPPYVLSVVSLSPHKNIAGLLDAFRLARERFHLAHELHLVGMPGIVPARLRQSLDSAAAAGLPVQLLGYVDEQTLRTQYQGACLLAFIPLIEGFGLPVLEAMAFGIPVVASRVSSVVEVCGNAALLVDPHDAGAVADAIGKVLTEPPLADRLRQAGRARVLQFRWEDAARATREVYEAAALRTGAARTPSG